VLRRWLYRMGFGITLAGITASGQEPLYDVVSRLTREVNELKAGARAGLSNAPPVGLGSVPGSLAFQAGPDEKGDGILRLRNARAEDRVLMSANDADMALTIFPASEKKNPFLDDTPSLLWVPKSRPLITLGVETGFSFRRRLIGSSYTPVLRLYNSADKVVLEAGGGDTPHLKIADSAGAEAVYVGLDIAGKGVIRSTGKDYAEVFKLSGIEALPSGSVVSAARDGSGLELSNGAYDPAVVGVISGAGGLHPGAIMGGLAGQNDVEIAMAGQVFVRVCAEGGPIAPGDLLVASGNRGVAMRGSDRSQLIGTVIGKALDSYASAKEGLLRMLVLNH
jgi:hypothetical protein